MWPGLAKWLVDLVYGIMYTEEQSLNHQRPIQEPIKTQPKTINEPVVRPPAVALSATKMYYIKIYMACDDMTYTTVCDTLSCMLWLDHVMATSPGAHTSGPYSRIQLGDRVKR